MENLSSAEVVQVALTCLRCTVVSILGYATIIAGIELGSSAKGYPGKGKEIHDQVMKIIFRRKNNK